MTPGHEHRRVHVREGSVVHRLLIALLQRPTLVRVCRSTAEKSRLVYRPTDHPDIFSLSPLGLLHSLFGVTLVVHPRKGGDR